MVGVAGQAVRPSVSLREVVFHFLASLGGWRRKWFLNKLRVYGKTMLTSETACKLLLRNMYYTPESRQYLIAGCGTRWGSVAWQLGVPQFAPT